MSARNVACALGICFLPLIGRLGGAGNLAFTMYSRAVDYRIEIIATDSSGQLHEVAPTSLATAVAPTVAPFLAGADHFRRNYETAFLRDHLREIARIACQRATDSKKIGVTLVERPDHGEERITRSEISCDD